MIRLLPRETIHRASAYRWASSLALSLSDLLLETAADRIAACFASLRKLCQRDHASLPPTQYYIHSCLFCLRLSHCHWRRYGCLDSALLMMYNIFYLGVVWCLGGQLIARNFRSHFDVLYAATKVEFFAVV